MQLPQRLRASSVCVHDAKLLCVRLRDPQTRIVRLFVPGGAIEAGETPAEAAVRETLEETGFRIAVAAERSRVASYPFVWDGTQRLVTTHFFAATLLEPLRAPDRVQDAAYNEGVEFVPLSQLQAALGFVPEMLDAALALWPKA